jgi:HD superfamily phosphohydrolase
MQQRTSYSRTAGTMSGSPTRSFWATRCGRSGRRSRSKSKTWPSWPWGRRKFGPKKHRDEKFSPWEAILAEIIVGDAFGVDRMDYLLRDSYHAGVAYGRFDHFRLIETLRILPKVGGGEGEPTLGIEEGGVHSAEGLLLARYFMYTQLYFHHVRRIYDYHLKEFLKRWLPDGKAVPEK